MNYWFIQHSTKSYNEHKNLIGHQNRSKISRINKGDKIIYYATGDMIIIGSFLIVSNISKLKADEYWGDIWVYKIKPIKLSQEPLFLPLDEILSKERKLKVFPRGKIKGITLKGRTVISLSKSDFDIFQKYITNYKPPKDLFKGLSNDEGLGEPMDIGIMRFTPTNEMGVVALFVKFMDKLGFDKFEFIRKGFPDACVYEKTGKGRQRKFIEFEYKASQFRIHIRNKKHNKIRCDYVVCWENDLFNCPIKIIELKSELEKLGIIK